MAKADPHVVLGVAPGASQTTIKAAWRRLARAHHPDLTGDDPAASRVATRKMAEINDAYAALTRDGARPAGAAAGNGSAEAPFSAGEATRRGGPPRPRPSRPVTGRVDTSATYRPRNQTSGGHPSPLRGHPPRRGDVADREPLRASTPTGPLERDRLRHFRRAALPPVDQARAHVIEFGKFHGHSLGDIAAFEPSYIDWLAQTVTREPELLAAARAIREDLDRRGVVRRSRPPVTRAGRSA
ncbi:MAG: DnaJ domain-containing protein [Chloroflexota bacterium]